MTDWTAGYVADIGYTFGYYHELNPLRVKLALLNAGIVVPEMGTACELGFGQGVSSNIHAAASATAWFGTDFNPAQAGFAQELATVSDAEATLYDESFADFCNRSDLPEFDFIGLHGIWSWISDENRAVIVEFIRRKLKVGGVLYISYNTYPAWAAMVPMRDLLTEHAEIMGASGQGIVARIDAAIGFTERLLATNPGYARANPQIAERIKKIKDHDRHYLAHEYFNRDWSPMSFASLAKWLTPAKLSYACSANYLEHVPQINLSADQGAFLGEIPDPMFRETVRDFMVNQQFRKDYWIRGARKLAGLEQAEALRRQIIALATHRSDVTLKVSAALGEAAMTESIYAPILDLLADHKPQSLGQLELTLKGQELNFAQILQAVLILSGKNDLVAVQSDEAIAQAKPATERLNGFLIDKARSSGDVSYLASPVTGGGILTSRFQQLFLHALSAGEKTPEDLASYSWRVVSAQGQKLVKEGKTLATVEENLAELTVQAHEFVLKKLPVLKALGVTA